MRTYAPCGKRPVIKAVCSYEHLSVMSGITPTGKLYTRIKDRALTSVESVWFLKHIQRQLASKLMIIWDGCSIHGKEVITYLSEGGAKYLHLEQLPAYAPELNPDEGVWQHLKNVELRNVCCTDLEHLGRELKLAIMRLRSKPHIIKSFFAGAGLPI